MRAAVRWPAVARGPGWPQSFGSGRRRWGILARPQPPLDLEAGARERVIVWLVTEHRCVQRGNRSPGCERGKRRPWHGGGCVPGPSSLARGPIFELWRRTVYFALQKRITYKARGRGTCTFCFSSRSFIFVLAPEVVNENICGLCLSRTLHRNLEYPYRAPDTVASLTPGVILCST